MTKDEFRMKVLKAVVDDIETLDDGFRYYWPGNVKGFLSAESLRIIADELDRQNEDYEKSIKEYFESHKTFVEPDFGVFDESL